MHEHLALTSTGKVIYKLKKPRRDGSTHVVLDPTTLLERLTALILAPRVKLINSSGVFASAFPLCDTVVPPPPAKLDDAHAGADDQSTTTQATHRH